MKYLYVSSRVEHRIENLKQSGKTGCILAEKVHRIIENLTSNIIRQPEDTIASYTKYGEKRIRNCLKYDLGSGFRLITLYRNGHIYMPYLGTHDACQRWLKNHTAINKITTGNVTRYKISLNDHSLSEKDNIEPSKTDSSNEVLPDISDKELRVLFSGLVQGMSKKRTNEQR